MNSFINNGQSHMDAEGNTISRALWLSSGYWLLLLSWLNFSSNCGIIENKFRILYIYFSSHLFDTRTRAWRILLHPQYQQWAAIISVFLVIMWFRIVYFVMLRFLQYCVSGIFPLRYSNSTNATVCRAKLVN